mmetsp:Transcript_11566/g.28365  ORF Transcript_11566/g.28365 Transcript_11566/m.28365 type:complete len:326 (-) Transcript_11566:209-1186(-)|eukprot:CAMPEP_0206230726 /NCGR_PEP_ID=MMETSP0047_2-20121206/10429_1 /ASSEMBLY_ACC=CAM_ASM_000192 /TAXON_ID=195065 /ORGANISM="Chroomonas mesostigmatica_cf, Strain CCMP1168" /LENGTH=325 /DNA_ID=CAMNT_0053654201 /DNA_START=117 /DNA_END=1094 /DNA_ORIENTATION=+
MAEDGAPPVELTPDEHRAATKIQAMTRGRQTRHVLSNNTLEGARVIFNERQAMRDRNMDASQLARTNKPGEQDGRVAMADREVIEAAHAYKSKAEADEERAAVQMQSLYRGFRDRKQVRAVREVAEKTARDAESTAQLASAKKAEAALKLQSQFQGYSTAHQDYTNVGARRVDASGHKQRKTATAAPSKKQLAPTLVDKKAIMSERQRAACLAVEDIILQWASSYARAVELRPGAEKTGMLEFVALFSKPSKEESIAWPVVRVNFAVPEDFDTTMVPRITYRLEGERMVYDVSTDFGRSFKESWLDRVVMDKRAIRADMALLHKR